MDDVVRLVKKLTSANATNVVITADHGFLYQDEVAESDFSQAEVTGWKILLDRGLDVFQRYEMNDAFSLANRVQKHRACKAFEVTYLRQ